MVLIRFVVLQVVALKDAEFNEISIEVDETCIADCGVSIAATVPRQTKGVAFDTKVPVSKLFDLAMPHSVSHRATISVRQVSSAISHRLSQVISICLLMAHMSDWKSQDLYFKLHALISAAFV